jgi:hypothetical protein
MMSRDPKEEAVLRPVKSQDGIIHIVSSWHGFDVVIYTRCSPHAWTAQTIARGHDAYVVHVDDAPTCIRCIAFDGVGR